VAPLPVDPSQPWHNIYGNNSFPPVDGVNLWPMLVNPKNYTIDAAHKYLVLSKEVLVAGKWKLLVSQPHFKTQNNGWKGPSGQWRPPNSSESVSCMAQDVDPSVSAQPVPGSAGALPCLFDLRADPGEHWDVSNKNLDMMQQLWAVLNSTILTQRDCNGWSYKGTGHSIPGPWQPDTKTTSCSPPELLGKCNPSCAFAKWQAYGKADGPQCGVPGCT